MCQIQFTMKVSKTAFGLKERNFVKDANMLYEGNAVDLFPSLILDKIIDFFKMDSKIYWNEELHGFIKI